MPASNPPPIDWVTAQARLLSDSALRAEFRNDPGGVANRLGIPIAEQPDFLKLDPAQLEAQANGLITKRMHEVRRLLPITFANLGERGEKLFLDYVESFWPEGHHRHLLDAVKFAAHLRSKKIEGLCGSEINYLKFIQQPKIVRLHLTILRQPGKRSQPGLQILFSRGRCVTQRFFYLKLP